MPGLNPPRVHVTIPLATPAGDIHYAFTWDAFTSDPGGGLAAEKDHILNYLIQKLGMKWIDPANTFVAFMNAQGIDDPREVPTILIRGLPTPQNPSTFDELDPYDIILTCDGTRTSNTAYVTLFSTSPPGSSVIPPPVPPEGGGNLRLPSPNIPGYPGTFPYNYPFVYTHFFQAFKTPNGQYRLYDYNPQDQSNLQYGVSIAAGWREPIASKSYRKLNAWFDSITINNAHPYLGELPSSWNLWLRAAGQWYDEALVFAFQHRDLQTGDNIPIKQLGLQFAIPEDVEHGNFTVQSSGWQIGNIENIFGVRPTYKDWDPIDDWFANELRDEPNGSNVAIGNVGGTNGTEYRYNPANPSASLGGMLHSECSKQNGEQQNFFNDEQTYNTKCDFTLHYDINTIAVFPTGSIISTNLDSGTFLENWGSFGSSPGQFGNNSAYHTIGPFNVAFDPSDPVDGPVLYATDPANNRTQKFDAAGTFIREWGKA